MLYTAGERDHVRDDLVAMARADARIVAAALVGAGAHGGGDRWSDVDLTLGVAPDTGVREVVDAWTADMSARFRAVQLFDLPFLSSLYRVFLLPGGLQVDLSFTPEAEFGALGPQFELLFGTAVERAIPQPAPARHHLGLGVHHLVRARICVERGRLWQAAHWIGAARDEALSAACRVRDLPAGNGRGTDQLPAAVLAAFDGTLVRSLDREELLRALESVARATLAGAADVPGAEEALGSPLRELMS
jgi:hypothetical protein